MEKHGGEAYRDVGGLIQGTLLLRGRANLDLGLYIRDCRPSEGTLPTGR
jgi:hypothetical protein